MAEKNRERKCNKTNYKEKQRKKRRISQRRESQAKRREVRKYVRKKVKPYYDAFRQFKDKHLLFVLKDTDNMERIILQKFDLENGRTLLALPIINEEMITQYLSDNVQANEQNLSLANMGNEALKGLIGYYFSINSDEILDLPQTNMVVFRNCKSFGEKDNLVALNVRPYDPNTWYHSETTTVRGYKVYSGKKLKTFFKIDGDLGKTYVFHDTLTEILLYRAMRGKINHSRFLEDHETLAKRQGYTGLYLTLTTDENELYQRYNREQQEDKELEGIEF